MRNALRNGIVTLALIGGMGAAVGQDNPATGQINRGAGEATRPPTGAPAGVMQQSGAGEAVRDVPASNTPSGAFPTAKSAAPDATTDPSPAQHQPAADAGSNTGLAPSGPIGSTGQTMPAKYSEKNAALDKIPIMAQSLNLTDEQRKMIYQSLAAHKDVEARAIDASAATELPEDVKLYDLPEKVVEQLPNLKAYKFARLQDKFVLVSAPTRIVVGEITQ